MNMSFYHMARESAHLLPTGEKSIKLLPLIVLSRVVEGGLLSLTYFLVYPALQRMFDGTLTLKFILGLTALMFLIYIVRALLFNFSAEKIYEGIFTAGGVLRLKIANHLRTLALGRFQKERLEQVKGILTDDMQVVGQLSGSLLGFFVSAISVPVFIAVGFLFIDWKLSVALSVSCILAYPLVVGMNMFIDRLGAKHFASISESSMRLVEYVLGIKVLKSYGRTGERFTHLREALNHTKQTILTLEIGATLLIVISYIIVELGLPIVLLYGTYLFLSDGVIDPAAFIFALIVSVRFYIPVQEALAMSSEFKYLQKAMDRVRDVLRLPAQSVSENPREPLAEDIIFENVKFSYDESSHPALLDINIVIPEKTVTAFVGPSGAGKTTLANLIARFWDVEEGKITIGGVNVTDIAPQTLSERISIVFQDVMLFDDTVFENIRLARPEASDAEVYQAAKDAYCHEFITELPDGYQTIIGENGSRLSGGEKQRLSIARALLKNAPIVLLDEATASVDPSSEQQIQKAFDRLFGNKTVLIIAHKLSTITHSDQIIVLDKSRIVQTGTHESLVKENGLYKRLWDSQQQALEWKI